ncbi:hypothetical protein GCM10009718_15030 [Isoptericola halotolerans]|uniref:Uncharacterized protein n=1 Tax=Isoptericola halotolerans TaxID=300560 RepID=A0ABX1ZZ42_9MICO|nr:hypothetical protein [Isoptericola halotolerans]NOV95576.1 hypothetical protein [Isoptericola halotolerans]
MTTDKRLVRLLELPAYRRTTTLQGPRPTIVHREAFAKSLEALREGARKASTPEPPPARAKR